MGESLIIAVIVERLSSPGAAQPLLAVPAEQPHRSFPSVNARIRGAGNLRAFLVAWAISAQQMPKLTLPPVQIRAGERLTQARRLTLLRRLLTDERPPARSRVAACLMLLYAQPASRIVRLTIDDIVHDTDQILLRLGDPPMPVPGPLALLILELAANRQNMNTAANPTCRWLFPGKCAGQPLHPKTLLALIHDLGVPAGATRTAALRQLVIQAPAPVVADALGYHNKHVTRVLADAGEPGRPTRPATTTGDHKRGPQATNTNYSISGAHQ